MRYPQLRKTNIICSISRIAHIFTFMYMYLCRRFCSVMETRKGLMGRKKNIP